MYIQQCHGFYYCSKSAIIMHHPRQLGTPSSYILENISYYNTGASVCLPVCLFVQTITRGFIRLGREGPPTVRVAIATIYTPRVMSGGWVLTSNTLITANLKGGRQQSRGGRQQSRGGRFPLFPRLENTLLYAVCVHCPPLHLIIHACAED